MFGNRVSALLLGGMVAAGVILTLAAPASAHVTVSSTDATQGGYSVLTFRVPTESATAAITKLQVRLPTEHPITSVRVQPQRGWSYKITKAKLGPPVTGGHGDGITEVVGEIEWTADSIADAIKPGEFAEFRVSAGPLPKVDVLRFGALETYSDGSVVAWNQEPAPGSSAAPEYPKPTLSLTSVDPRDGRGAISAGADGIDNTDSTTRVLAIAALALAAASLGVASLRKRTKRG